MKQGDPELEHFILQSVCSDVNWHHDGAHSCVLTVVYPEVHSVTVTTLQDKQMVSGTWSRSS